MSSKYLSQMLQAGRRTAATIMRKLAAYTTHPDPLTAATCLTAFVIGANGPFYPLYLYLMIGVSALPTLLTMLASPLFLAIPFLARRYPRAARIALPVLGTLNTIWCAKLLGAASGVELFLLPCINLAALSFTATERRLRLASLALPIAFYLWQGRRLGPGLLFFTPAQDASLLSLNIASVGLLTAFIGLAYAEKTPEKSSVTEK